MAVPASQVIARWVCEFEIPDQWTLLREVCFEVIRIRLRSHSEESVWDIVEERLQYVAEHIRNDLAFRAVDGIPPDVQIDDEQSPYVRAVPGFNRNLLAKMRRIQPRAFELLCGRILERFEAEAEVTRETRDGGVDFFALNFDFIPDGLTSPRACRVAVIGQAKRYAETNAVSEIELRSFLGGALKRRHELDREGKLLPLSPVLYAFWTTSDFGKEARDFARAMGFWYMEGRGLARYVEQLGLEAEVLALPDDPSAVQSVTEVTPRPAPASAIAL